MPSLHRVRGIFFEINVNNQKDVKMTSFKITLVSLLVLPLLGCGVLPIQSEIKEDHLRFENFKRDISDDLEYVYLMCANKKPTSWLYPRQFASGAHELWVKVKTSKRDVPHSTKVAVVNIKVTLDADKSYMLNRKIVKDEASLWIQEVDTGITVSNVLVAALKRPSSNDYPVNLQQCQSGSV